MRLEIELPDDADHDLIWSWADEMRDAPTERAAQVVAIALLAAWPPADHRCPSVKTILGVEFRCDGIKGHPGNHYHRGSEIEWPEPDDRPQCESTTVEARTDGNGRTEPLSTRCLRREGHEEPHTSQLYSWPREVKWEQCAGDTMFGGVRIQCDQPAGHDGPHLLDGGWSLLGPDEPAH